MNEDSVFPEIGEHVKCLLVNNTLVEGHVMTWDPTRYIKLKSLDGESVLIIHHPERDIMMTKVVIEPEPEAEEEFPIKSSDTASLPELETKWEETLAEPSNDELRTKKLAELKVLMTQQEKKIIRDKIKSHESSSAYSPRTPLYQTPDMKKIGIPKSPYKSGKIPRK